MTCLESFAVQWGSCLWIVNKMAAIAARAQQVQLPKARHVIEGCKGCGEAGREHVVLLIPGDEEALEARKDARHILGDEAESAVVIK